MCLDWRSCGARDRRVERTFAMLNMSFMFVTRDVLRLSGWLKLYAAWKKREGLKASTKRKRLEVAQGGARAIGALKGCAHFEH